MFADPDFASFSQEIGLASLGASDDDIKKLAACYWHSVEFGLLNQKSGSGNEFKAYGAGLLSSFGELAHSCQVNSSSKRTPFSPSIAANTEFPITEYQPVYFVASSLKDAKDLMRKYCEDMPRPFYARYNDLTNSIWVDRAIKTSERNDAFEKLKALKGN
jgi:phenylalanine-4-hydroxylase